MKAVAGSVVIVMIAAVLLALVFLGLRALPEAERRLLQDFQTLFGGLAALCAAIVGFWNVRVQIRAEQKIEREKLEREKQALAGSLAGELRAMLAWGPREQRQSAVFDELSRRFLDEVDRPEIIAASADFGHIYRQNAQKIGILPAHLPESVADLYGRLLTTVDGIRQLTDRMDSSDFSQDQRGYYSLISKGISKAFARFEKTAPDLIEDLDRVRARKPLPHKGSPAHED